MRRGAAESAGARGCGPSIRLAKHEQRSRTPVPCRPRRAAAARGDVGGQAGGTDILHSPIVVPFGVLSRV